MKDNQKGWVKLHRSILEWEWYDDNNTFKVFIHCLLRANHQEQKWRGQVIEKGSFITSYSNLANECKLTTQQVRTSLNKLKKTNEVTIKTTNKNTCVTVCKYDSYQVFESKNNNQITNKQQTNNKQITNKQQTNNKQITTNNNDNNYKNEKNVCVGEKFTHESFLNWFNDCRKYLGLKSNIKRLSFYELEDFNELKNLYTIEDFKKSFSAFSQDEYYKSNNLIFPKYFLKNETFVKYLNTEVKDVKKEINQLSSHDLSW